MVLLSIRVNSENLETQTWREWIRDVPTEATNITIQGIYRSFSTLLLLTIPIETWTLLPDNAAYSFVGFVTSSNLAPTLLGKAKSTTLAKEQSAAILPKLNIFEDIFTDYDSSRVIITTIGDLTSAKRATVGTRSVQFLGHIDDDTFQHLSRDHNQVAVSRAAGLKTAQEAKIKPASNYAALVVDKEEWGPEHTSIINTVNNLGLLYKDQGKLAEAEAMYQRALEGYEKTWGPEYTSTLATVNNLGNLYADQGKLAEAEAMYQRALDGYEKALGHEQLNHYLPALNTMENYSILLADTGSLDQAEELLTEALSGLVEILGLSSQRCQQITIRLNTLRDLTIPKTNSSKKR